EPRLHEMLHGPARSVALAADPDRAGRDRAPAPGRAVLDLQLRLLGAADDRRARRGAGPAAGPADGDRPLGDPVPSRADPTGGQADHPALVRAGEWLLGEEVRIRGDWSVRRPRLAPGGWAFEFQNDLYPDVDDTAVVVLALRALGIGDQACGRGLDWIVGMQS